MEKISEIIFTDKMKIMDAFDVVEQFTMVEVNNIEPGLWYAFNEEVENEYDQNQVTEFLLVNKQYFENHPDYTNYDWQRDNDLYIDIEKGMIGVFNENFVYTEKYLHEITNAPDNESNELKNYVVCSTPLGEDGFYTFDTVKFNEKIVAIKFNFSEEEE